FVPQNLKLNGTFCRENLRFYRRNLKFTVPNLLPAEKFLFKFRLLMQSKEIAATHRRRACHHSQFDFAGDTPTRLAPAFAEATSGRQGRLCHSSHTQSVLCDRLNR